MASLDFDIEQLAFHEYYAANAPRLQAALQSLLSILQMLLSDRDEFASPVVTGRIKDRDECVRKFKRKYLSAFEEQATPYTIKDAITDLVGLRVTCLHEPDITHVANILRDNFEVLNITDKTKALEDREDAFGYKGLHMDLRLKEPRNQLPEYARLNDLRFELQLRTLVQDAWATIDHKIKYKKSIPLPLKRRINRLAALFELADQEFLHIRDETQRLEKEPGAPESTAVVLSQEVKPPVLDAFHFQQIARELFPDYPFDPTKIEEFVEDLLALSPELTAEDVRSAWNAKQAVVEKYREYLRETLSLSTNPYTRIRYALYMTNPAQYQRLLFNNQRKTFIVWQTRNNSTN